MATTWAVKVNDHSLQVLRSPVKTAASACAQCPRRGLYPRSRAAVAAAAFRRAGWPRKKSLDRIAFEPRDPSREASLKASGTLPPGITSSEGFLGVFPKGFPKSFPEGFPQGFLEGFLASFPETFSECFPDSVHCILYSHGLHTERVFCHTVVTC